MKLFFGIGLSILLGCSQIVSSNNDSQEAIIITVQNSVKELDTFRYNFPWLDSFLVENTLINRIQLPIDCKRISDNQGSFSHWLRRLPLKPGNPQVKLYNGELKWNQSAHAYVVDLDVGTKDLQQCADATMRLRAEYLFNANKKDSIHFNYTNGAKVSYSKWRQGYYPTPKSGTITWSASSKNNGTYPSFKKYMIQIFNYAGTLSLSRELKKIPTAEIQSGDLFLYGGSPGHAVIVMDVAIDTVSQEKYFLLAQSYMPAQEMHILKNPNDKSFSPWYKLSDIKDKLETPEWTFNADALVRW